ncbi:MAG: hypothetical protein HYS15_02510 [Candidatus Spechtbacteria bacterium]|nr:hypothetical protein [Candidatus Spechtbacteria bacterium]
MTDQDLISQLQTLKTIHPDKRWVVLARERFAGEEGASAGLWQVSKTFISSIFNATVSYPAAISVAVVALVLTGGISAQSIGKMRGEIGENVSLATLPHHRHISAETAAELVEMKQLAVDKSVKTKEKNVGVKDSEHAVVLNENSDKEAQFKNVLRERIESKIAQVKDRFAQLENGDSALEISLNPRRYEENFKLADEKIALQANDLLKEAETALLDGNLIDALDFVNAIEKLTR